MRSDARPGDDAPASAGREALARLRRFGGDALVRDMSAILLADVPERLRAARAGLGAGDAAAVRLATHAMKSSCAQFGAVTVATLCEAAEAAAGRADLAPVASLLDAVEREFDRFRGWLDREVPLPSRTSPAPERP